MVTQEAGFRIQCPKPLGTDLQPSLRAKGSSRITSFSSSPIGRVSCFTAHRTGVLFCCLVGQFSEVARRLFVWRLSDALQKDQEFDAPDVLRETLSRS
jgi:hypothetical protein